MFQVDLNAICKQGDIADMLFAITFTLLSGKFSTGHLHSLNKWHHSRLMVFFFIIAIYREY